MTGIARMRAVVLDCPDPKALAQFYRALVGGEITYEDDVDAAEAAVLALGATKHAIQPGDPAAGADGDDTWRVFLDPAGHPFCLCWD